MDELRFMMMTMGCWLGDLQDHVEHLRSKNSDFIEKFQFYEFNDLKCKKNNINIW